MTAREKIARYLLEALAMEQARVRELQEQAAIAPVASPYRLALEAHLGETREHVRALSRRLGDVGRSPGLAGRGVGAAQRIAAGLVSAGRGPFERESREQRLLRDAKQSCASEALEIATYDALEALSRQAGDELTADLAATLRADEERMLETLTGLLPRLTAAVVGAELPDVPAPRSSPLPSPEELTVAAVKIGRRRQGDDEDGDGQREQAHARAAG